MMTVRNIAGIADKLDAAGFSEYKIDYENGVVYVFFNPADERRGVKIDRLSNSGEG